MTDNLERPERLQVMLNEEEFAALDTWRFDKRMPSRAAAVRFLHANSGTRSADFGLLSGEQGASKTKRADG